MSIKDIIKNIDIINRLGKNINIKKEFRRDAKDFCENYMFSAKTYNHLEYQALLLIHSLEKGMCSEKIRPFGNDKVKELLLNLRSLEEIPNADKMTVFSMGVSILRKWIDCYSVNKWEENDTVHEARKFIEKHNSASTLDVGKITLTDFGNNISDYLSFLQSRHSIRKYAARSLLEEDVEYCVKAALAAPSACNRQMCKIYHVDQGAKKKLLDDKIIGIGGFDTNYINYFIFTFDMAAFSFYGERNQGYFNVGLFSMNFANALHYKGIGSCFLQWSNNGKDDEFVRKELGISKSERIVVVLAAGYYPDKVDVPASHRKTIGEVYKKL